MREASIAKWKCAKSRSRFDAMRNHCVKFHSADDPSRMRFGFAIRCRQCGSRVFTWLDMSHFRKALDSKSVEENVFRKLMDEWSKDVPTDCDEAMALNLTTEIHES